MKADKYDDIASTIEAIVVTAIFMIVMLLIHYNF